MPKILEGKLLAEGKRFSIIVSRFNDFITDRLLSGAVDALIRCGAQDKDIEIVKVPGSFEIPLIAKQIAAKGHYHAVICLGAVIRGDTPHFEYIAGEVSRGISSAMLEHRIPIAFGVLTTNTVEQAIERAGSKMGNKGFEAAQTAIEMASLSKEIS